MRTPDVYREAVPGGCSWRQRISAPMPIMVGGRVVMARPRTRTRPVALSGSVLDAIGRRVWIVVPQAAVSAYQPRAHG